MEKVKNFDVILVTIGGITTIYANVDDENGVYLLIFGILILMFGLYKMTSKIPSKKDDNTNQFKNKL